MIGLWLDKTGGDVLANLVAYQPEWLTCGIAAWNDLPNVWKACPSLKGISLRNTNKPLLARNPEQVADEQCNFMDGLVAQGVPKGILYAHGLDEEHGRPTTAEFEASIEWEERWLARVHARGYRAIGWNTSFGWNFNLLTGPQKARLQTHWHNLDLIGRHSYLGWLHNATSPREASLWDTVYAPLVWNGFPVEKWLATEGGYDFWSNGPSDPGWQGEGSPGWRATGLTEQQVASRILEVCQELWNKGAAGYTIFAERCQNDEEWRNFYPTDWMRAQWKGFKQLRLPEAQPPQEDEMALSKEDLEKARVALREPFLNVQRVLNLAKTNASFEEQGKEIDGVFSVAGDGANEVDKVFADLSKKL